MNVESGSCSPEKSGRQVERTVLLEIVALHPDRLTPEELSVGLEDQPDRLAILDAIDALKRSGLVRSTGEIIEPTHPATCMAAILELRCRDAKL
jgi:hypothetical protein